MENNINKFLRRYDWNNDILDASEVFKDEELYDLYYQAAEKELEDDEDADADTVTEAASNIIGLYAVPTNSMLYALLLAWYGSEEELQKHVRSCFYRNMYVSENATERTELMFFVTGCGYDIMDADLLGGNCNGETKRAFNSFVDSLMFDGTAQPYTGHEKEAY